jgi:hypothetical protein
MGVSCSDGRMKHWARTMGDGNNSQRENSIAIQGEQFINNTQNSQKPKN